MSIRGTGAWFAAALMAGLLFTETAFGQETSTAWLNGIASRLSAELEATWDIRIVVTERNERMVSVERLREPEQFVVTFDRDFLSALDEGEITAAIAHEIGHIWIFCHFPYLHTELLANEIALNLVEREQLERLYTKLRARLGDSQTVEEFLASNIPATKAQFVKASN